MTDNVFITILIFEYDTCYDGKWKKHNLEQ